MQCEVRRGNVAFLLCWAALMLVECSGQDSLALLSGTLRTIQTAACDGQQLHLRCPAATAISISLVQYGRTASGQDRAIRRCERRMSGLGSGLSSSESGYAVSGRVSNSLTATNRSPVCVDRTALRVVVSRCAGQTQCSLQVSPRTFGVDPCPGLTKYVEVLYKCRPSEFRSEVVCAGQARDISCAGERVAVYSARYGVSERHALHCPQPQLSNTAGCEQVSLSEQMISRCQGRSTCHIEPPRSETTCPLRPYLTVTFTCVAAWTLRGAFVQPEDREMVDDIIQRMVDVEENPHSHQRVHDKNKQTSKETWLTEGPSDKTGDMSGGQQDQEHEPGDPRQHGQEQEERQDDVENSRSDEVNDRNDPTSRMTHALIVYTTAAASCVALVSCATALLLRHFCRARASHAAAVANTALQTAPARQMSLELDADDDEVASLSNKSNRFSPDFCRHLHTEPPGGDPTKQRHFSTVNFGYSCATAFNEPAMGHPPPPPHFDTPNILYYQ